MRLSQLRQRLRDLGAAPCHQGRVLRAWVQGASLDTKRRRVEGFVPLAVRDELPDLFGELRGQAQAHSAHPGDEGSAAIAGGAGRRQPRHLASPDLRQTLAHSRL